MFSIVKLLHPSVTPEHLGLIPHFLDFNDVRSAREQFDEKYIGGWRPMPGFTLLEDGNLQYPDDPPLQVLAEIPFGDERVFIFDHAFVCVKQKDGSFEVARMD